MANAPRGHSPESPTARGDVTAAGAVVLGPGRRVLLVHRPKYDDWSFPKGKVERGEHPTAAAIREIDEETGVQVRLGVPLGAQHYRVARGDKTVHYWVARPVGEHHVERYRPNAEVDRVCWLDVDEARRRLSYPHDADTLAQAIAVRRKTRTLILARHAQARSRRTWRDDDRLRPLLQTGATYAARLAPVLGAYDVRHLVSSPSTRCVQTLTPYAERVRRPIVLDDRISEEGATSRRLARVVRELISELADRPASAGALAVCSHRPVLPVLCERLGLGDPRLAPGEVLVVHLRDGAVVTTERHGARAVIAAY